MQGVMSLPPTQRDPTLHLVSEVGCPQTTCNVVGSCQDLMVVHMRACLSGGGMGMNVKLYMIHMAV